LCYIVLQEKGGFGKPGTITIRLPEKLQRDLDKVVKTERTSRSDVIRDAIERYIALKRFQQLRKRILPFAEAEGLITDEDVFKAIS
jgi:predicted transcriptional regulator